MIKVTIIKAVRIIGALLILLSGKAFAVTTYATQAGLNTEISNRKAADTAEVTARNTAITTEKTRATLAERTLNTAITTETARAKAAEALVHIVGESYQGSIVFWVDPEGQHGLIAARNDNRARWYNGTFFVTNATADGIYAGAKNTDVIVAAQASVGFQCGANPAPSNCPNPTGTVVGDYAALSASHFSIQDDGITSCSFASGATHPPVGEICYGDWYLPSKVELDLLYKEKAVMGGGNFNSSAYWTSTEKDAYFAWTQSMVNGTQNATIVDKQSDVYFRVIRAF
jgi:hypothetical protein